MWVLGLAEVPPLVVSSLVIVYNFPELLFTHTTAHLVAVMQLS